jgi:AraC family transcriptional activator of pobA
MQMTYEPADPRLLHVEVIGFDDLRRLNQGSTQRCDFLVMAFVTSGSGTVAIDFEEHEVTTGSVVWVAPGAVHRWIDFDRVQGSIVLCRPSSPLTPATRNAVTAPRADVVFTLDSEEQLFVEASLAHLKLEVRPGASTVSSDLHAALLTALLARIPGDPLHERRSGTFDAFRACIESDFRRHRDVAHYARRLGYSERTLTRSAIAATGRPAKRVIEERVVLEAQRLLAHHRMTSTACATELGFSDPSAFSTFFSRVAGIRPGAWQSVQSSI